MKVKRHATLTLTLRNALFTFLAFPAEVRGVESWVSPISCVCACLFKRGGINAVPRFDV